MFIIYLLSKTIGGGEISVALTVNGGISTSTNGIHFPVCVVIVHHMEIPMSTSAKFKYLG